MAKAFSLMPGPRGLPFIGSMLRYSALGGETLDKLHMTRQEDYKKYGDIYKEKLGSMTLVYLFDTKDIAKVFRNEGKYPHRPTLPMLDAAHRRDGLPMGFGNLNGESWYKYRQSVNNVMLAPDAASVYLPLQNQVADDFMDILRDTRTDTGHVTDMYKVLATYAAEAFGAVCFSTRIGVMSKSGNAKSAKLLQAIGKYFDGLFESFMQVPTYLHFNTPTYRKCLEGRKTLDDYANKRIQDILDRPTADGEGQTFLHEVLRLGISATDVSTVLVELFTAGIDSTGNTLSFLLYNLARSPEKQEKLREHISAVLEKGEPVTHETIRKLSYLKACVKESFRLYFPVIGGTTRILEQDTELGGYMVPKGTIVSMNHQTMCLHDKWIDRPDEFIPERWLPKKDRDVRRPEPFVMMPFGFGSRMCIGRRFAEQEVYLAAIKVIQNFKLQYDGEPVGMSANLFCRPDRSVDIRFLD